MTKQVQETMTCIVSVIHQCKNCNDEGVKITNDSIVKCYDCNTIKNNKDAQSWFEIKKDGGIGVKAGVHLTQYPGQPWERI